MALEGLALEGLDVNDNTNFKLLSLVFTPAQKLPQYATNADADGEVLIQDPHYTNAIFELAVRVTKRTTALQALTALSELTDRVQAASRTEGGIKIKWTPKDSGVNYTWYAELGEIPNLPTAGEEAAWTNRSPIANIKLTCKPFGYAEERTIKAATESGAEPLQTLYVPSVKGDAPAEARLIVKDKATQDRRYVQFGRDVVASETNPALLIVAASLTTTGFTGEAKTRSGAYSEEKVKRGVAVSQATTLAGTGRIEHIGSFGVYLRVYAGSSNARFRISYKNGDGPLIPLEWKTPPAIENFSDIYMGEVALEKAVLGTQTSEIRIETKSEGAAIELDVNYITLIPTRASGKARGIASSEVTALKAYDEFLQTEGALATKVLPLGGTWSGTGDAVDFTVIAASDYARRTEISDANLNTGRYGIAGTGEYTTIQTSAIVTASGKAVSEAARFGVFARYTNAENWLMAVLQGYSDERYRLVVLKRVAGTVTTLGESGVVGADSIAATVIQLLATASGTWAAWANSPGVSAEPLLSGQDSVLATGGTLATGKVGIYDAWTSASANTRTYDSFYAIAGEDPGRACYSTRQIEFRSDGCIRQDSTGVYDGPPSRFQGANFYLDPAGSSGVVNRLAVRARRNDVELEPDSAATDKQTVEVKVIERYLIPR